MVQTGLQFTMYVRVTLNPRLSCSHLLTAGTACVCPHASVRDGTRALCMQGKHATTIWALAPPQKGSLFVFKRTSLAI